MRRGTTFWGLVFIVAGIVFLLNTLGLLAVNVWGIVWPLFLVLLGLWIISGVFMSPRSSDVEQASIPLAGASRAHVSIGHGAGQLMVASGASGNNLLDGSFGGGVDSTSRRDGDKLDVKLRMRTREFWGPWNWSPGGFSWDVRFNETIPLTLDFDTGASDNRVDLTNLKVEELRFKTGASSSEISLPAHSGRTRVQVSAGAASVVLHVPQGVGARIRARGGLAGINVDSDRFPRSGDIYQSADYESAVNRIDIESEMGVGSIDVR